MTNFKLILHVAVPEKKTPAPLKVIGKSCQNSASKAIEAKLEMENKNLSVCVWEGGGGGGMDTFWTAKWLIKKCHKPYK